MDQCLYIRTYIYAEGSDVFITDESTDVIQFLEVIYVIAIIYRGPGDTGQLVECMPSI